MARQWMFMLQWIKDCLELMKNLHLIPFRSYELLLMSLFRSILLSGRRSDDLILIDDHEFKLDMDVPLCQSQCHFKEGFVVEREYSTNSITDA